MHPEDETDPPAPSGPDVPLPPTPSRHRRRRRIAGGFALLLGVTAWLLPNFPTPRFLQRWPEPDSGWSPWEPVIPGADYRRACFTRPRPMRVHEVRIDLQEPSLELMVAADRSLARATHHEARARYPTTLARRHHLALAFNATLFDPDAIFPGTPVDLIGLARSSDGDWSAPVPNLDAVVITPRRQAILVPAGNPLPEGGQGFGGLLRTLTNGVVTARPAPPDAVSLCGISADGRHLYWLIVDGRQPGWSEGATPAEAAALLRDLGARDALNLDGGPSVTLVRNGTFGPSVVNRPCHPVLSGLQRPVGLVVGVRPRTSASSNDGAAR